MLRFMAADRAFATNKYLKIPNFKNLHVEDESRSLYKMKWEHITAELNMLGPPSRTKTGWKKVWIDYIVKVKNKLHFNKEIMEENPTNYHQHKIILTPDELIVKRIIEGNTTYDVSPIEETCTLDDSQTIEAYVIINSSSSSGSNTADESPVVVESEDPDFIVPPDATILKPKLIGTTLSSSKCSAGNLVTSLPTTSQSDNNIKLLEKENEEIEKHLDKLKRKRKKVSDEIINLKQRELELKEKLHELQEQSLQLKCQNFKYKAQKLELKRKELRIKEAAKLKNN